MSRAALAARARARYHGAFRTSGETQMESPVEPRQPASEPAAVEAAEPGAVHGYGATRVVLVEPSHPGNVGAAARALKTMGFGRLVLVNPRLPGVLSDPEALALASGAGDVLASARIVTSLEQALSGTHWSLALTARLREYGPPTLTPRAAATQACVCAEAGEIALVFGNERTGLANADVERCTALAHIPANPIYSSLNLAQAVQVLCYELRLAYLADSDSVPPGPSAAADAGQAGQAGHAAASGTRARALAASDDIEGLFAHLEKALVALDFLDPQNPKKLMPRLRRLFGRTGLEAEEVNILRGIAKHILLKLEP
jgi:tRNA/rRNA methyltransferase